MKKIFFSLVIMLLICPLLSMSISASETNNIPFPKLKLDWRMDLLKENVKHNTQGSFPYARLNAAKEANNEGKDLRFTLPIIRLDLKGKFNDNVNYRVRYRLNRSTDLYPANIDETSAALDYAYVEYKGIPDLTLRFGKDCFFHGGWESSISSKDGYSFSQNSFSKYMTGIGAFYNLQKIHQFGFQVLNNTFNEYNQRNLLYGGSYQVALFNELLNPLISYHVDPRDTQLVGGTTPGKAITEPVVSVEKKAVSQTYFTIGNRLKYMNFILDVDYIANKTEAVIEGDRDSTDKAYASTLFYKYNSFRPQIKYAQSKIKAKDIDTYTRHNFHAILEYYFNPAEDLRFHVGFTGDIKKYVSGEEVNDRTYILGMAGSF